MPPTMPIVSPIQNPQGSVPKWRSHHQPARVSPPTAAASSIPNPESFIHSVSAFLGSSGITPTPLGGRSVAQNRPACDKCHKRDGTDTRTNTDLHGPTRTCRLPVRPAGSRQVRVGPCSSVSVRVSVGPRDHIPPLPDLLPHPLQERLD